MSRPGPSTGVVSRPVHQDRTGDLFDYYVSDTDTCDSGDDDNNNNNNNNDNGVGLDDKVNDDPPYSEGNDTDEDVEDDLDYIERSDALCGGQLFISLLT